MVTQSVGTGRASHPQLPAAIFVLHVEAKQSHVTIGGAWCVHCPQCIYFHVTPDALMYPVSLHRSNYLPCVCKSHHPSACCRSTARRAAGSTHAAVRRLIGHGRESGDTSHHKMAPLEPTAGSLGSDWPSAVVSDESSQKSGARRVGGSVELDDRR